MNLIAYLLKSRGLVNSMQRLPTIATRFGFSTAKMDRALNGYVDIANAFGTVPTLAVTANLIERHPRVFERLSDQVCERLDDRVGRHASRKRPLRSGRLESDGGPDYDGQAGEREHCTPRCFWGEPGGCERGPQKRRILPQGPARGEWSRAPRPVKEAIDAYSGLAGMMSPHGQGRLSPPETSFEGTRINRR